MKREYVSIDVSDIDSFKQKMLNWSKQFNIFCFLDNHNYEFSKPAFHWILATGKVDCLEMYAGNALGEMDKFIPGKNDWLFGHLNYDLKNEVENLSSDNFDGIHFPDLHFFSPEIIIECNGSNLNIGTFTNDHQEIFDQISKTSIVSVAGKNEITIQQRFSKEEYISVIDKLKEHIHRGDCYEINFCQEFYAEHVLIDPLSTFLALLQISPNPFSCFYKIDDKYLLCASPERFIKKKGAKVISQPIKGTAQRDLLNFEHDELLKDSLINSEKERAENVMIVDLVRNDLSRICKPGTVSVEELFGIYAFPQVYQMISTVVGEIEDGISTGDIFRATFPMGSMTGAPKKRVMELIEQYERTKRCLFSGSVGYINPNGDFDFNVVIRSIQYNSSSRYLSFMAGSAITFSSNAEMEYEECLLKASAIKKVLGAD